MQQLPACSRVLARGHSKQASTAGCLALAQGGEKPAAQAAGGQKEAPTWGSREGSLETLRIADSSCFWFMRKMSSHPGLAGERKADLGKKDVRQRRDRGETESEKEVGTPLPASSWAGTGGRAAPQCW